ncbi:MFS transporter [Micromonospora sp. WMMD723]|uniref:MFS transporter n=1 Tax=Micromonospora sp. WMMD723 TaxID=3403465 RepID=UPI003CE9ACC1
MLGLIVPTLPALPTAVTEDAAAAVHQSTWTFFLTHQFAWGTARSGTVLAAGALAGAPFQARAVGPVVRRLGDKRAAVVGGLLGVVALAGTAFVTVPWLLHLLQAVGVLAAVGGAAAQSWLSRLVRPDEQGTVQGALSSIGAAAETVVPVAAGAVFAWSLANTAPGPGLRRRGRLRGRFDAPAGHHTRPAAALTSPGRRCGENCATGAAGPAARCVECGLSLPVSSGRADRLRRRTSTSAFAHRGTSTKPIGSAKRFGSGRVDSRDSEGLPLAGNGQLLTLGTASAETG